MTVDAAALPLPYEVHEGRPGFDEAVAELITDPEDPNSLRRTIDAIRALVQFPATIHRDNSDSDAAKKTPGHPVWVDNDGNHSILGHYWQWRYEEAEAIVTTLFGPDAVDNTAHCVAHGRTEGVDDAPDLFFLQVALLLKAGWTQNDGYLWWTAWPIRTASQGEVYSVAARWAARWDLVSFNACVRARMSVTELNEALAGPALPDPATISVLNALAEN